MPDLSEYGDVAFATLDECGYRRINGLIEDGNHLFETWRGLFGKLEIRYPKGELEIKYAKGELEVKYPKAKMEIVKR